MTGIVFATCEIDRALSFINKIYSNHEDLTEDDVPHLAALINKDIIRVQDPDFHSPCQIIAGKQYNKRFDASIIQALEQFQEALAMKKRKNYGDRDDLSL